MKNPDFDELKRFRRMGRKMTAFYSTADVAMANGTKEMKISCKVGCAGCCHLLTLISLPEGVAIAEHFLADVTRRTLIPLLMQSFFGQLKHLDGESYANIRDTYFRKKVPCSFLDTTTNRCTIYSVRPSACRYHMVVSDPAACHPDSGDQMVQRVDSLALDTAALSEAIKVSNQTKIPLYVAPMPVVMLWAFKLLIEGREGFENALKDPNLGAMDLNGWIARLRESESEHGSEIQAGGPGMTLEEVVAAYPEAAAKAQEMLKDVKP